MPTWRPENACRRSFAIEGSGALAAKVAVSSPRARVFLERECQGQRFFPQRPKRSLQDRILNSVCRNCNRKGHWKAECPYRQSNNPSSGGSHAAASTASSMPTTTVTVSQPEDILPLEFLDLPSLQHGPIDETLPVLMNVLMDNQWGHAYNSGCIQGESYNGDRHSQGCKTTARQRLQAWGFRKNEQCRSLQTAAQLSQMLHS